MYRTHRKHLCKHFLNAELGLRYPPPGEGEDDEFFLPGYY